MLLGCFACVGVVTKVGGSNWAARECESMASDQLAEESEGRRCPLVHTGRTCSC